MLVEIMLVTVIILLVILIWLSWRGKGDTVDMENVVSRAWSNLGLDEKIGKVEILAGDIRRSHLSLEQMLKTPKGRGSFGELSLEYILSDQLPKKMYGIRKAVLGGKKPDAHIKSTVGIICIDSKFPLDNYVKFMETDDKDLKEIAKRAFTGDVRSQLEKIAIDYVCPEKGSAEFAFAFFPSEAVYWFLVSEAFDLMRNFAKRGVQVVSPLTLSHKIELIKAGVHAKELSEQAEKIQKDIFKLSSHFNRVDKLWSTLFDMHVRNLKGKADEFESAWKLLGEEFRRIETMSDE